MTMKYILSILYSFFLVTIVSLPITFVISLFGYCVLPVQLHDLTCETSNWSFIANSIGLGGAGAFISALAPIRKFLNKPIHL